jgi:hypothetical protein
VGLREGLDVLKKKIITKPTDLSCILFFIRMPNILLFPKTSLSAFGKFEVNVCEIKAITKDERDKK